MTDRRSFLKMGVSGISAAAVPRLRAGSAQTVLGPLDSAKLGFTLAHEHIADAPYVLNRWPKGWGGRTEFVARAVEKLKVVKDSGVGTIVDLTPYDDWRDIRFLRDVSEKSGLSLIASTGQRFFPPKVPGLAMPARSIEGLTEFFIQEIEQGIDQTGIKAGVIKIGIVAKELTPLEEIGLRAGARASKATGVPIRTHTDAAHRAGETQALILEDEGVHPARVSFDHSDDSGDMDYFLGLVRRGYSLGMDHVHRGMSADFKPSFQRRVECIKLLIDAGFVDRLFLSQDCEFGGSLLPGAVKEWRETIDPPDGLLFASRRLVPSLTEVGVASRDIQQITVENPRRFFARGGSA